MALALAGAQIVILPPNLLTVALAALATAGLAASRRLGPLPAALLVALVLPWGRGADTFTVDLAGFPIRPHDAAIGVGFLLALPALRRPRVDLGPVTLLLAALLALGGVALAIGLLSDHPFRDVFRDARWWLFYGAGLLAVWTGTTRAQVLRALLVGTTLFAGLVVVATILPAFPGGLKDQELLYDRGTLRMQFGNSAFLLPAIAWVAHAALTRTNGRIVAWLGLLLTAVVLSLTRTSIIATLGGLALVVLVVGFMRLRRGRPLRLLAVRTALISVAAAAALAVGVGLNILGTPPATEVRTSGGTAGQQAIDRLLFQDDRSDVSSLEVGRFPSYRKAAEHIVANPLIGGGWGKLTEVDYAYNEARAHTIGMLPGVDNAYLTIGLKSGIPGMVLFGFLMLAPLLVALRRGGRHRAWFLAAWLGLLVLSMTQSFATSLYGPFGVALLLVVPVLAGRPLPSRAQASAR